MAEVVFLPFFLLLNLKILGLYCIKLYWRFTPEEKRKVCVFSTSCSKHVYYTIETFGIINGFLAYMKRRNECNSKYSLKLIDKKVVLVCSNGISYPQEQINPLIVKEYLVGKVDSF